MKTKPFGYGSHGHSHGYSLTLLTGWLEDLADTESGTCPSIGKRAKRLELVERAVDLLNQAIDILGDDDPAR